MASLTEDLAQWLHTHNPRRDERSWRNLTHEEKEVYRNFAWELQQYVANKAHEPEGAPPKGYVLVHGYFRRATQRAAERKETPPEETEVCQWCGKSYPKSRMNDEPWPDENHTARICDNCIDDPD